MLDFDVSYVDDAYLPVTMAVDGGITAYMGSKLALDTSQARHVRRRLMSFLSDPTRSGPGSRPIRP